MATQVTASQLVELIAQAQTPQQEVQTRASQMLDAVSQTPGFCSTCLVCV